jgi:hypothetical protein
MKRLPYLLVLLLLSAQVDDAWAVAPVLPSAPLADDNDEYLPAQRRPQEQRPSSCQKPVFEAVKSPNANFSFVPRGAPSERNLTTPFGPPPLYVFMSLRI